MLIVLTMLAGTIIFAYFVWFDYSSFAKWNARINDGNPLYNYYGVIYETGCGKWFMRFLATLLFFFMIGGLLLVLKGIAG